MICTLFTGQTSKEGIFMRYSYEFKKKCIELYREGVWPQTPNGIKEHNFHLMICRWARMEDLNGPQSLIHKGVARRWTPDEKLALVSQVIAGRSNQAVAIEAGISDGMLYQWVRKYKALGYNGLINKKRGRPSMKQDMNKLNANTPRKLEESEHEELIRLRSEIEYIKAENAVIKKEIALREEKEAARLKAKKQQLSKTSDPKDSN
jgi:transposase-like protein